MQVVMSELYLSTRQKIVPKPTAVAYRDEVVALIVV
jgi:hypothetical protein